MSSISRSRRCAQACARVGDGMENRRRKSPCWVSSSARLDSRRWLPAMCFWHFAFSYRYRRGLRLRAQPVGSLQLSAVKKQALLWCWRHRLQRPSFRNCSALATARMRTPKVDRLTEALKRLHNEQANEADIGEGPAQGDRLQEERLKLSTAADSAATGRRAQNNIRRHVALAESAGRFAQSSRSR